MSAPAVYGLPYGELAVALHASDAPTSALRDLGTSAARLTGWAAEGLARLGPELTWWRCYRTRRYNSTPAPRRSAAVRAEYAQMWPDRRRFRAAYDAANRIAFPRGGGWPGHDGRTVRVEFPAGPGMWFVDTVQVRDLEMAARYPGRAATDPGLWCQLQAHTAAHPVSAPVSALVAGSAA